MLGSAHLGHPAESDGDLPHVRVHGEVVAPQAEHEHARDRLGAHALVAAQLRLDLRVRGEGEAEGEGRR